MLTEGSWDEEYELISSIEYETAECELLTADMAAAENRLLMLAQRAKRAHDIAVVTRLRLTLYTTLDRSDRAVDVFLDYLQRRGTHWSPHPTSDEVRREYDRVWSLLGTRQIEELVDLPLMTNPDVLDVVDVFTEVVTPAVFCDENLSSLVICRMVNLSLEHCNSDASCFAYVWFAIIAGPRFSNYKDGFRFGRLGYELVEKRGLRRYQARTYSDAEPLHDDLPPPHRNDADPVPHRRECGGATAIMLLVDVVRFVEAFGTRGLKIERPDEIAPTLERALEVQGPVLVGVRVDYRDNHRLMEMVDPGELN